MVVGFRTILDRLPQTSYSLKLYNSLSNVVNVYYFSLERYSRRDYLLHDPIELLLVFVVVAFPCCPTEGFSGNVRSSCCLDFSDFLVMDSQYGEGWQYTALDPRTG